MRNKKENNRMIWLCPAVVFVMGVVLGCMKETSAMEKLLKEGVVLSQQEVFFRYFITNAFLLFLCWVWGYFMPLLPLACIAIGYKAYTIIGAAITAVDGFGRRGVLFYFSGVLPHNGVILFFMCLALVLSARLPQMLRTQEEDYAKERCAHGLRMIPLGLLLVCAAFIEMWLFEKALAYLRA